MLIFLKQKKNKERIEWFFSFIKKEIKGLLYSQVSRDKRYKDSFFGLNDLRSLIQSIHPQHLY